MEASANDKKRHTLDKNLTPMTRTLTANPITLTLTL